MPTLSPQLSINGVSCCISLGETGLEDGLSEAWPADGPTAEVFFKCVWEDHYTLAQGLMGSSSYVGGILVRVPSYRYPTSKNLSCLSLGTIRPIVPRILQTAEGDAPAGWFAAEHAVIPAKFGILGYDDGSSTDPPSDPSGQPWTTTRFRISGDVFTPPSSTFYYCGYPSGPPAGVPVHDSLLGIVRPQIEISMMRHKVAAPFDILAIMNMIGTVNEGMVRFGNQVFTEGHLLFAGFNATQQRDSLGNLTFEVEYGILGRQDYGWNTLMAQNSEWYIVNSEPDESGNYPFEYRDFSLIP